MSTARGNYNSNANRERGVVRWFNAKKGYGFLQTPDGRDVFVHFTAIQASGYRELTEGQQVEFEIASSPKGPKAENVSVVGQ